MSYEDRLASYTDRGWEHCWNHYYSTIGKSPAITPADVSTSDLYPYTSRDALDAVTPDLMRAGDRLTTVSELDPSRYSATALVFTGKTDLSYSVTDLNFRVPPGIFEYIPPWLAAAQKRAAVEQDRNRWDMRKMQITDDWRRLPQKVVTMIGRVADGAFVNLGHAFGRLLSQVLFPLSDRVTQFAKKAAKQAEPLTWILGWAPALGLLAGRDALSRLSEWTTGAVNWCKDKLSRALSWFAS